MMQRRPTHNDFGLVFTRDDGEPLLMNNVGQREYAALIFYYRFNHLCCCGSGCVPCRSTHQLNQLASTHFCALEDCSQLHQNMAEEWRRQIIQLRDALTENRCDPVAREAVRSMVEEIRLTPRYGGLGLT